MRPQRSVVAACHAHRPAGLFGRAALRRRPLKRPASCGRTRGNKPSRSIPGRERRPGGPPCASPVSNLSSCISRSRAVRSPIRRIASAIGAWSARRSSPLPAKADRTDHSGNREKACRRTGPLQGSSGTAFPERLSEYSLRAPNGSCHSFIVWSAMVRSASSIASGVPTVIQCPSSERPNNRFFSMARSK